MHATAEEQREPVRQVASRLRTYEDFNLASRLQDEEFGHHYALNRSERRRMGNDLRHSRRVQAIEDHIAACNRAHENSRIAQTDEALARRLQLEFEREESLKRETQTRLDAEFARRLQLDEEIQRQQAARARVEVEDERLAWQLQHQFDADQRTGAARRTEASTKKVLPPLASVTPKIRIGEWRSPARRLRSNSERNVDPQWCDRIDERSQNELNLQMATANGISVELDEPPPRANANFAPSTRNRTPLATLAGRDPRSGSCAQKTISRTQQQKQQYIQCVHGTHACAQSGPGSAREISLNSACMTRPQEASVSGADLIQLSPALIVHDQQVSEQTLGFRAHQHSSVFNLDEVSFGGGFPEPTPQTATVRALPSAALFDSRQTPGAVPIASSRGLRTDTISRSQVAESRSQISPASKEVSLPLICNEATSSIPLLHQTTASAVSLLRPLVPERVGSVPLPTPASALPKQAVGTSVTAAVELLENQLFVVLQPPIVPPPLTFDNHTYQTNTLAVTAEQLGQQPSAQISTQFISTSTLVSNVSVPQNHPHSLSNDVSLQQTQPASNTANLHPTNPFLKDLQTASWNESAVSPLSYRDAARLDEAVMVSANSNGDPQLPSSSSTVAFGLTEESKAPAQPVGIPCRR